MKSIAAALLLASTSTTLVRALPEIAIQKRDRHTNGRTRDVAHGVVRRAAGTLETTVFDILTYSTGGAYYANISVGTPPQDQTVIIDTGSSDLYLDASSSQACESTGKNACRGGDFDPANSSTYKIADPSPAFNTSFGDGSTAYGPYALDTVTIGDVSLENAQFGVATTVVSKTGYALGLLGVGYSADEATEKIYPNVPEALVEAGVINSRLYSVYLNDGEAASGSILFGGIDTDKYTGNLQTVPTLVDAETREVDRFITAITALSVNVGGKTSNIFSGGATGNNAYSRNSGSFPVLLDTGSAAWSVSPQLYELIVRKFPYVKTEQGTGITSCSNRYTSDSLTVTFNGAININVPVADFILPAYNPATNEPIAGDGEDVCVFMIVPSEPTGLGFQPAGDAILRSMYIVYDLDNGEMALAQSNPNSTSSNIKTVAAGPSGIANAATNVKTIPANTNFSIAATAPATVRVSAVTDKFTLGAATGTGAVPENAVPGQTNTAVPAFVAGSNGGSGSASSSSSSGSSTGSKGAAAGLSPPAVDWRGGMYVSGIGLAMAGVGAVLML